MIIIFLLTFQFDNILMEESAQILEIETFIPLLLQVCYLQHQIILYCICDYQNFTYRRLTCMYCFYKYIGYKLNSSRYHFFVASCQISSSWCDLKSRQMHKKFTIIYCMEMDRLDIGGTIDCKIRDINNMYRYLPYARMSYFLNI